MRYWMHGVGKDIPRSVRQLNALGFEAVVDNQPETIEEAKAVGLDVYLCTGAFSASGKFSDADYLARDVKDQPQLWFGSACPNHPEVRRENLKNIAKLSQTKGIQGVLIDGARFASPASSPDIEAFYTCFCPICEKKAAHLGFDVMKMRKAVESLDTFDPDQWGQGLDEMLPGLLEWFRFRRICTTEHLIDFCKTVKQANPALLTGIYIFTPSLAWLVGQSYQDLRGEMDIFAPMIYRSFKALQGPACLNFELSALVRELGKKFRSERRAIALIQGLTGLPIHHADSASELQAGLSPGVVGSEVNKAKTALSDSNQLIPIIQLEDDRLEESIREVRLAGADGVNFFLYQAELMEKVSNAVEH